jgi:hypothetical protein
MVKGEATIPGQVASRDWLPRSGAYRTNRLREYFRRTAVKHKSISLLLFLSLLTLLSPIQSMAQSRCSSGSLRRGKNGVGLGSSQLGLAGGSGLGIAGAPLGLLGGSGFGIANAPLGLLGGSGVRVGNTHFGLFNGPGILNYDYQHVWMPGPAGAITVIVAVAGGGALVGTLVSHKDKKKGAIIGAAAGAGAGTLLWLYKNRTERRAIF